MLTSTLLALLSSLAPASQPVTTGTLLGEMVDLSHLARHPGSGVRVVQFSSYDRRSNLPGGPDWFGNSDGFGGEPIPNFEGAAKAPDKDGLGEYVICDVKQPGAIVRTWTAAMGGTIRVYLDGADKPWYEGPAEEFLMHRATWAAKQAGLDPKGLTSSEQRYSDYFPVPFAKSCRIAWLGKLNEVHFYHVQVKLFPPGTAVTTFAPGDPKTYREQLAANEAALKPAAAPLTDDDKPVAVVVVPGERKTIATLKGPGEITRLLALISTVDRQEALRGMLLRITFDGHAAPQVLCPVGDFFASAPGVVACDSLPMSVHPGGTMTSRWVMPYKSGAVVAVENHTAKPVAIALAVTSREAPWDDRSMHFRARWRAEHDLTAKGGNDAVDLPFLSAHGQGVYVGTAVHIMSPCPVPTAGGNWWGEGDEKVFVDGEPRPSIFGTGSEDYFNYAWSESDLFQYPYFAQPICTGPETRGYITNTRWHILDAIPFDSSMEFAIELFSHSGTPHLSYSRISYWYAKPGARDDTPPIQDRDLVVPPLLPWTVKAAGGAAGATIFEAETAAVPSPSVSVVETVEASAGKLARFTGRGDIKVSAAAAGKHRVTLTCTSGPQKTAFNLLLDGKPLPLPNAARVELQTPYRERLVNLHFEPVELTAGEHTLTLDPVEGAVGVDFVWVKPAK